MKELYKNQYFSLNLIGNIQNPITFCREPSAVDTEDFKDLYEISNFCKKDNEFFPKTDIFAPESKRPTRVSLPTATFANGRQSGPDKMVDSIILRISLRFLKRFLHFNVLTDGQ